MKNKVRFFSIFLIFLNVSLFSQNKDFSREKAQGASTVRGRHVMTDDRQVTLNHGKATPEENHTRIDLFFSGALNPHSLDQADILINGKQILPKPEFTFNREGNILRFSTKISTPFSLTVKKLKALNGSQIPEKTISIN